MFPASKFYIEFLENKYPEIQCSEPVMIRSLDDPTGGQSNIVVSKSAVQISELAHVFFFFFFMISKVKATTFVGSETDRFL